MIFDAFVTVLVIYGFILFITSFAVLKQEVKISLSPDDIELIDQELKQRRIVGLLLLLTSAFYLLPLVLSW